MLFCLFRFCSVFLLFFVLLFLVCLFVFFVFCCCFFFFWLLLLFFSCFSNCIFFSIFVPALWDKSEVSLQLNDQTPSSLSYWPFQGGSLFAILSCSCVCHFMCFDCFVIAWSSSSLLLLLPRGRLCFVLVALTEYYYFYFYVHNKYS